MSQDPPCGYRTRGKINKHFNKIEIPTDQVSHNQQAILKANHWSASSRSFG
ncbi:MAG: hypothetical protein ACOYME_02300 [Prochlorotrichaceae cyanobacterium]